MPKLDEMSPKSSSKKKNKTKKGGSPFIRSNSLEDHRSLIVDKISDLPNFGQNRDSRSRTAFANLKVVSSPHGSCFFFKCKVELIVTMEFCEICFVDA